MISQDDEYHTKIVKHIMDKIDEEPGLGTEPDDILQDDEDQE